MNRPCLKLWTFGLTLALASCTLRSLALKHADKVVMHEVDKYFDLSPAQDDYTSRAVKSELTRLKRNVVPGALEKIEAYGRAWQRGPEPADTMALLHAYESLRLDVVTHLAPAAGEFLATLSDAQVEHLAAELKDANEESVDAMARNPENFAKKRKKELLKTADTWLGSLSDEQEEQFLKLVPSDPPLFLRFRDERLTAQQNFLALLRSRPGAAAITQQLVVWGADPQILRGSTATVKAEQDARVVKILRGAYDLATSEQKRHAAEELRNLVGDVRAALH